VNPALNMLMNQSPVEQSEFPWQWVPELHWSVTCKGRMACMIDLIQKKIPSHPWVKGECDKIPLSGPRLPPVFMK
jgi:hypothetical protein